jgi:hypothetical protein
MLCAKFESLTMKRLARILIPLLSICAALTIIVDTQSPKKKDETPKQRFYRKGGKETKASVIVKTGKLIASDIAQERDLASYDDGGDINCRVGTVRHPGETAADFSSERCQLSKLRDFVWEHWQTKRRGYLRISFDSVDAVSTSHLFIEPESDGKWHVAWRIVRHFGEITDMPNIRGIKQRPATSNDFECRCSPGSMILSFIDWEGDEIQTL